MELTNPEQEQSTLDAEWQVKAAEAQYKSTKAQLDSTLLDQKAKAATVQSDYTEAQLNADRDVELAKRGLGSELNAKVTHAKAEAWPRSNEIEKQRLAVSAASAKAQLDEQQAKVEQLRALVATEESPACFAARAGGRGGGVAGAFRGSGPARGGRNPSRQGGAADAAEGAIEDPRDAGQGCADRPAAAVDTRNGIIPGHVMRVDPSVVEGSVTVDVKLDAALPKGARPDLSVEGTIEIENLADVVYVGRPGVRPAQQYGGNIPARREGKGRQPGAGEAGPRFGELRRNSERLAARR
jgi:HlyD family secretion protein